MKTNIELNRQSEINDKLYSELAGLESKYMEKTAQADDLKRSIITAKRKIEIGKSRYKKMLKDENLVAIEPEETVNKAHVLALVVMVIVILISILVLTGEKGTSANQSSPDHNEDTLELVETSASPDEGAQASSPWYMAWDDLQGKEIPEANLWSISQHWDSLASSGCDPNFMAAIWFAETGNDVTSNNPFQLLNPSPDQSEAGFASDARVACEHLHEKARQKGNDLPDVIDQETIGIYLDASYGYNGRAYGSTWDTSPYVANNLDSGHVGMMKCQQNGCRTRGVSRYDGVFTFYLKLLRRG